MSNLIFVSSKKPMVGKVILGITGKLRSEDQELVQDSDPLDFRLAAKISPVRLSVG